MAIIGNERLVWELEYWTSLSVIPCKQLKIKVGCTNWTFIYGHKFSLYVDGCFNGLDPWTGVSWSGKMGLVI